MRISGLASGMDIDSIVKDMMKIQRLPMEKLQQKKQTLEWQRDDYRSINTLLLNFRQNDLLNMKLSSAYRSKTVGSSDESKLTATATSAASNASYKLANVTSLAQGEVRVNKDAIYQGKLDISKPLFEQNNLLSAENQNVFETGAVLTETLTGKGGKEYTISNSNNILSGKTDAWSVKVDGKAYKVVKSEAEMTDSSVLVDEKSGKLTFNNPIPASSQIKVDYIGKEKIESVSLETGLPAKYLSQNGITVNENKIKLVGKKDGNIVSNETYTVDDYGNIFKDSADNAIGKINRETGAITFIPENDPRTEKEASYTLDIAYQHKYAAFSLNTSTSTGEQYENFIVTGKDALTDVMNKVNNSKVGVSMFYDSMSGQMTMTRKETGIFRKDGNTSEIRGEGSFLTKTLNFDMKASLDDNSKAANAEFDINGLTTSRTSNVFDINGVTFNIKSKFDEAVTIGVSNDSDKVYENITNFIKKYNEMIGIIQSKLDEKRNKNYQPLTDEQKESLSDKQQEKWEEIAKMGLLRRDPLLSNVLSGMRTDFYGTVKNNEISSAYDQLSKIGITTTANYLEGGKLEINEAKLKKAIQDNPESVEQLFRGENGILQRLTKTVNTAMDNLKLKAGNANSTNTTFTIGRELNDIDKKEDTLADRLKALETRYYNQFTAMEQAIQKANSQSSYLSGFFSN